MIVTIISLGIIQIVKNVQFEKNQIELKTIQIQNAKSDLKLLQTKYDILNSDLEKAKNDKQKIEVLEKEKEELDTERKRLETELHAKLERKEQERIAEEKRHKSIVNTIVPTKSVSAAPGTMTECPALLKQAGIPVTSTVLELIRRESNCNHNAVNPSSGACGIGQQLPCGKWKHKWNDPVGSLIDMNSYVMGRYGSWEKALSHHDNKNWY